MTDINIYSDGGARGNPGPAGIGFLVEKNNQLIHSQSNYIGINTNNVAEHLAIQKALNFIYLSGFSNLTVNCFLDSELVVKQLRREYRIKNLNLSAITNQTFILISKLKLEKNIQINLNHITRDKNKKADQLANLAMDSVEKNIDKQSNLG